MNQALIIWNDRSSTKIGELVVDVSLSETHSSPATLTENPVEDGSVIGTHLIINPKPLGLKIHYSGRDFDGVSKEDRAAKAYQELISLQEEAVFVEIVTGIQVYENMLLTSVGTVQSADSGDSLTIDVSAKQVRIAQLLTRELEPDERVKHGTRKKNVEQKTDEQPSAETEAEVKAAGKRSSVLYDVGAGEATITGIESVQNFFGGS